MSKIKMKRATDQPSTSGLKRPRSRMSGEEARQLVCDSEDNESDANADYPDSELESVSDNSDNDLRVQESDDEDLDLEAPDQAGDRSGRRPGRGRRPDPDAYLGEGWNKTFTPVDIYFLGLLQCICVEKSLKRGRCPIKTENICFFHQCCGYFTHW